jgi:subfamily B ATP-binding cassette protein HlyB/CyaB
MQSDLGRDDFFWILQSLCIAHSIPFSAAIAQQQLAAPFNMASLASAAGMFGLQAKTSRVRLDKLSDQNLPLLIWLDTKPVRPPAQPAQNSKQSVTPALLLQTDAANALILERGKALPTTLPLKQLGPQYSGHATRIRVMAQPVAAAGEDDASRLQSRFGFRWFFDEILKYKTLWQEIVLASLVIQLIGLATPLFTQAIIDKVVVHHTQSTLLVIGGGMAVFVLFSGGLNWLRQYLVLHTGNRVDAALGAAVFERLFKLPPMYFQHRPTGVISARLHGIETIREFIAGAAITLVLDLPFLLIFAAIMFYYSLTLTLVVVGILLLIVVLSLALAPVFQRKLQNQFQLGAANQAFLTEYIAGIETVKSLQFEPQLNRKYSALLSSYLTASFDCRQLANTYNTVANFLEQTMTLLVLIFGAWQVMHDSAFTIGMLVAFQMFAGRLSQPMLRIVGLWQQFQQARLAVDRLGDLMNAPVEPYSLMPARAIARRGDIQVEGVAFRYGEKTPLVYESLSLHIRPGQVVAIVGPSGCGKSTLAKLIQGFYQPSAGRILVDGIDIAYLSANELRSHFGVVPQETMLFSGTIYDNLLMASPQASFEEICAACRMAEIHKVIEALPVGYQTVVGERGAGLSGGQRQRIAIARALLKRPDILVFDEATSALDGPTAEQFAQTINALRGKVTMLFISHGLPKGLQVDAMFQLTAGGARLLGPAPRSASVGEQS